MSFFKGSPSESKSGLAALPTGDRKRFSRLAHELEMSIDPSMFSPMGITSEEQEAVDILRGIVPDEAELDRRIEMLMNPYEDIVVDDINRQFEGDFGALNQLASQAGAFGSSRMRDEMTDIEDARLRSVGAARKAGYDTALQGALYQIPNLQNIQASGLMGFGGLERQIDLQQKQAPITAYSTAINALTPLLNSSTSRGAEASMFSQIVDPIAQLASAVTGGMQAFGGGGGGEYITASAPSFAPSASFPELTSPAASYVQTPSAMMSPMGGGQYNPLVQPSYGRLSSGGFGGFYGR